MQAPDTESSMGSVTLANARLAAGGLHDVRIEAGVVHSVHPAGASPLSDVRHDLAGSHLRSAFCEPHVHLDKVLTAPLAPSHAVGLAGAIDAHRRVIEMDVNGHEQLVERARRMLERLLLKGVLAVRSHVNVGDGLGLRHLLAMREAAEPFRHLMTIQLFAMLHTPLSGSEGQSNRAYLRDALEHASPDGIGGCPHLDPDPESALDVLFAAARESGLPLDLHTDETIDPSMFTLPGLATRTESSSMHGRVAASHCVSLGMQSHPVQTRTARELADAGVAVVVLPQTNLYLNAVGVDTAPPRGIAPVTMLVGAGVVVAAGSDNLQDPFNPVGDADPLHTASLMVTAAHQLPELALRQISEAGRAVLGLAPAGVSPGMVADLVAVPAGDEASLIAECRPDRMVISRGRLVASTSIEHHVWR